MTPNDPKSPDTSADRLERALRAGLRPVDPGPAFTATLQARLILADPHTSVAAMPPRFVGRGHRLYLASLALAASMVVALGITAQIEALRGEQRAALAHTQQAKLHAEVLLALEITSERLGLAQQRIEQFQAQEIRP